MKILQECKDLIYNISIKFHIFHSDTTKKCINPFSIVHFNWFFIKVKRQFKRSFSLIENGIRACSLIPFTYDSLFNRIDDCPLIHSVSYLII